MKISYRHTFKILTGPIIIFSILCLIIAGAGCSRQPEQTDTGKQVVTVQRGDLTISTLVDGNLVMPQAFDLRFGAPGNVEDVFVEEGDFVKAGTVLARLDNLSQQLDIKSANCALQQVVSNLYETIPAIQQTFMGFAAYYPNASALLALEWIEDEVSGAYDLFLLNKYDEAAAELQIAVSDLDSCVKIFREAMESLKPESSEIAPYVGQDPSLAWAQEDPIWGIIEQLQNVIDSVTQVQEDVGKIQTAVTQGNQTLAEYYFGSISGRLDDLKIKLTSNVNRLKTWLHAGPADLNGPDLPDLPPPAHSLFPSYNISYPGKDLCLYFYGVAADNLSKALTLLEQGDLYSSEYNKNLRIARHYMELCNSIMGSNLLVLEHGLSLKNTQQYNVDLAKAAVTLENRKDDLLKTIIIAPFDGTVVSVGAKRNDILSALDYSSKSIVQLVDTSAIKFEGLVDEIDILKIQTGQKATISIDAVPDKVFNGTVTFISPYGATDTGTVVKFAITIKLERTDVDLKGGLSATATISISGIENVLLVPLAAVTTTPTGSSVMLVDEITGATEQRQVTLGRQNYQFAEVLSGLKEGDKLLIEESASGAPVVTTPPGPPPH